MAIPCNVYVLSCMSRLYGLYIKNYKDVLHNTELELLLKQDISMKKVFKRSQEIYFNPLQAKFFRENINIYWLFVSFLHIDMTQVLKILSQVREGLTCSI